MARIVPAIRESRRTVLAWLPATSAGMTLSGIALCILRRQGSRAMDEDAFNMAVRKFLKEVGVTSQREIERIVRDHKVAGDRLKLRMTLTAEDTPLNHIVESEIDVR
jgi:hypothetical protein